MRTINRIFCSLLLAGACSLGAIAQENQSYFLHTIEKGQSLYSISSMYGVTQSDIVKLNPGSDEKIFVGRTLRIPRTAANTQTETFHTIAQGETLYRLTVKYGESAKAICDANPGLSAENFRIGIDFCSAPVRFYHNKVAKQYLFIVHIAVTQVKAYRGIV